MHCYILNIVAVGFMVSEKIFLKFMEANDPQDMAHLNHKDMVGKIYLRDHKTLLYTKYISCVPHGYRKEEGFFSNISL